MGTMEFLVFIGIPTAVTSSAIGFGVWTIQRKIDKKDAERDQERSKREKEQEKREQAREERDVAREKNEILIMKSIGAAIALGEATACAIKRGKCNGEMETALEYAKKVKHEQKDFLTAQAAKNLY